MHSELEKVMFISDYDACIAVSQQSYTFPCFHGISVKMHIKLRYQQGREFCWCDSFDSLMALCSQTWADSRLFTPVWKANVGVPISPSNWPILICSTDQYYLRCTPCWLERSQVHMVSSDSLCLPVPKNKNDVGSTAVLRVCVCVCVFRLPLNNPTIQPTVFRNNKYSTVHLP